MQIGAYSQQLIPAKWRTFGKPNGKRIKLDILEFLTANLTDDSYVVHIGVDSADIDGVSALYALCVSISRPAKGAICLYSKLQIEIPSSNVDNYIYQRLYNEATLSVDVASLVMEAFESLGISKNKIVIDYDFNNDAQASAGLQVQTCKSNKLVSLARGFASSLGLHYTFKPDEQIACVFADRLVQ